MIFSRQTLRTDKEKESAKHDEEVQELVDKHNTEQMEIGKASLDLHTVQLSKRAKLFIFQIFSFFSL